MLVLFVGNIIFRFLFRSLLRFNSFSLSYLVSVSFFHSFGISLPSFSCSFSYLFVLVFFWVLLVSFPIVKFFFSYLYIFIVVPHQCFFFLPFVSRKLFIADNLHSISFLYLLYSWLPPNMLFCSFLMFCISLSRHFICFFSYFRKW